VSCPLKRGSDTSQANFHCGYIDGLLQRITQQEEQLKCYQQGTSQHNVSASTNRTTVDPPQQHLDSEPDVESGYSQGNPENGQQPQASENTLESLRHGNRPSAYSPRGGNDHAACSDSYDELLRAPSE
jgi:hypothetical protein